MKHEKLFVTILSVVLIALLSFEPVLAFITTESSEKVNKFISSEAGSDITEDFDGEEKKDVQFDNTGDTALYFRVALTPMWVDDAGNIASTTPVIDTDYLLDLYAGNGWIKGADGYYYYKTAVEPGASTNPLIELAKPINSVFGYDEDGRKTVSLHFELDIAASSIQAVNALAVEAEWGVTVSANGELVVTGGVAV